MILWLVLTLMTSVAAILVLAPLIRNSERRRVVPDLAVYQDQLKEVETEAAQGFIDPAQAESASMEIKRRILAADRLIDASSTPLVASERNFALVGVAGIVVLGSVGLYAATGRPELASAVPRQATQPWFDSSRGRSASLNPSVDSQSPSVAADESPPAGGLPSVDEMIQRLVARLHRNPKDAEGWRTLGWSYFSTERYDDAVEAYTKAIELNPASAEYRSARSEAMVYAAKMAAASASIANGPTADDVPNAKAVTPSDRTAMIRNMVDGLAARLEKSPRDVDGWIKLIRSRVVLGETDAAKQSLDRALKTFANDDRAERNRIIDAAQQLGINP